MPASESPPGWLLPLSLLFASATLSNIILGYHKVSPDKIRSNGTASEQEGPRITADLTSGFCGQNLISLSRLPIRGHDQTSWSILLSLFLEHGTKVTLQEGLLVSEARQWSQLPQEPLSVHDKKAGITISRATFINLLVLSNARPTFAYADAAGYRAGFGSWVGQWYVNWPMNGPAHVSIHPHDSHNPSTDVYPRTFNVRVDCCIQMMAGIVSSRSSATSLNVGFPGRMDPGSWHLEFQRKGFAGSHGSRHIYNMNGGYVYEADFLLMRPVQKGEQMKGIELELPSLAAGRTATLWVDDEEERILKQALDHLPWTSLSWSIHRGLRDILVAFSKETMDHYRQALAESLQELVSKYRAQLVENGWASHFVDGYMGQMAASAVLAGRGNSGDMVRIVTSLVEIHCQDEQVTLDETKFWRRSQDLPSSINGLDQDTIAALVKCFVLEWSVDFNYQLYHQLPTKLLMS